MLKNIEGQNIPQVTFPTMQDGQWINVTSNDLFANKTVVLFALPGAFTPTCSSAHVPRYNELFSVFDRYRWKPCCFAVSLLIHAVSSWLLLILLKTASLLQTKVIWLQTVPLLFLQWNIKLANWFVFFKDCVELLAGAWPLFLLKA